MLFQMILTTWLNLQMHELKVYIVMVINDALKNYLPLIGNFMATYCLVARYIIVAFKEWVFKRILKRLALAHSENMFNK